MFAKWFEAALLAEKIGVNPIDDLYILLWFYNDVETLIEAAYLINKEKGKKNIPKN